MRSHSPDKEKSKDDVDFVIVGGSGFIGGSLKEYADKQGLAYVSGSRHPSTGEHALDLLKPATWSWLEAFSGKPVIIAAGITQIAFCEDNPEVSRQVNVDAIKKLLDYLAKIGCFSLVISSTMVFSGTKGFIKASAAYSPQNQYGAQKVAIEQHLLSQGYAGAVVRLSKVFGARIPLFEGFISRAHAGEVVTPYSNYFIAPVAAKDVAALLIKVGRERRSGIFQFSSDKEYAYADVVRVIFEDLGLDLGGISPSNMVFEPGASLHASLENCLPDDFSPNTELKEVLQPFLHFMRNRPGAIGLSG